MTGAPAVLPEAAAETDAQRGEEIQRWSNWAMLLLDRIPLPFSVLVLVLALAAMGEQVLEYTLDPSLSATIGEAVAKGLVLPVLIIYILIQLRVLKNAAVKALAELRPSVPISDDEYEQHVHRMISADVRIELLLLAASIAIVLLLFTTFEAFLLNTRSGLPAFLPATVWVVAVYGLLGWLLLSLAYWSIRQARALRALARCHLKISLFDLSNLVPFGRLGLLNSLPTVGIILIPMILFGLPTGGGGFLVIGVSLMSLLTFFYPLWGVHRQMDEAKEAALANINEQLEAIQAILSVGIDTEIKDLAGLADRTNLLTKMRELTQESPTWPFKDSAAVARAILAVSSPLIYFVLTELVRAYLLPLIARAPTP